MGRSAARQRPDLRPTFIGVKPMYKPLPSANTLRKLISYDPETGVLTWLPRTSDMFEVNATYPVEATARIWNMRFANTPALALMHKGYLQGTLLGRKVRAHRVAFKIYWGYEPAVIDHINQVRSDNRISNLRAATVSINGKNTKIAGHNTSGVMGVHYETRRRKWVARVHHEGATVFIGYYATLEEAAEARKAAEVEYGYHPNHGVQSKPEPEAKEDVDIKFPDW